VTDADREIKLTVRVSLAERLQLRQRAFSAGLPVAVYLRTSGLAGSPVAPRPPAPIDLPDPCKKLLFVCHGSVSNFTQLAGHSAAAGEPLSRVGPLLLEMQSTMRNLGMSVKAGELGEAEAQRILDTGLLQASDQINVLCESLNEGQTATNQTWHTALTDLRTALEQVK